MCMYRGFTGIRTIFLLICLALLLPVAGEATVVRMQTSLGLVDIELFDAQAPQTVSNFLNYVNRGAYNGTFLHRSIPGFVIQGGGYALVENRITSVPKDPPVVNEYSRERSNVRGTIAMAKVGGDPNSATCEWFFNLADNNDPTNPNSLDNQNGGFTVFGRVMGNGMATVDKIAALQRVNAGGAFTTLPLLSIPADGKIHTENLVILHSAAVLLTTTAATQADRLFNYLEAAYPNYLAPGSQPSASFSGYYYRFYPGTGAYIAVREGELYYLGPASNWEILSLGPQGDWLGAALAAGY